MGHVMPNFCFDNALANEKQRLDLAHLLLYVIALVGHMEVRPEPKSHSIMRRCESRPYQLQGRMNSISTSDGGRKQTGR
jgi:hypothetical protein